MHKLYKKMKKTLLLAALMTMAFATLAQTTVPFKIQSTGQISLQSGSTKGGIQITPTGYFRFEPSITSAYGRFEQSRVGNMLSKNWIVRNELGAVPSGDMFYVLGNGSVYSHAQYTISNPAGNKKALKRIENASELVANMKGYYFTLHEFDEVDTKELYGNENIKPKAIEGLLKDFGKERIPGMNADELEEVLPEVIRHTPDGETCISYDALIPVLIEAFKEQQARIGELENILRENGLMQP